MSKEGNGKRRTATYNLRAALTCVAARKEDDIHKARIASSAPNDVCFSLLVRCDPRSSRSYVRRALYKRQLLARE